MTDVSGDDLIEAADRLIAALLATHGIVEPPVDAEALAQTAFGLTVRDDEEIEEEVGRFGPRPKPRRGREIVLRPELSPEGRNAVCGRACAKELVPALLSKVGVTPGTENRGAQTSLIGLIMPRLLLPTKWFEKDARKAGYDLWAVKERYPTAGYELIAARFLDTDEPMVIAIVDDGNVTSRRGNRLPAMRKLLPVEERCRAQVAATDQPARVRADDWTVQGWPIPAGPFNRIILRSVPDDVY